MLTLPFVCLPLTDVVKTAPLHYLCVRQFCGTIGRIFYLEEKILYRWYKMYMSYVILKETT